MVDNELVKEFNKIKKDSFKIKYKNQPWNRKDHKHYPEVFKKCVITLLYINKVGISYKEIPKVNGSTKIKVISSSLYNLPKELLVHEIFTYFLYDHFKCKAK